jgi:hypothetical protein
MEEKIFVAIVLPGQDTPAPGTEHITTKEQAIAWLETNQVYTANEAGAEFEFDSKYVLLER